jgi:hypothetical protein
VLHCTAALTLSAGGGGTLLLWQFVAVLVCCIWACFWTFAILKFTAKFTPIRASEACEAAGLDIECHGEMSAPASSRTAMPLYCFCGIPIETEIFGRAVLLDTKEEQHAVLHELARPLIPH